MAGKSHAATSLEGQLRELAEKQGFAIEGLSRLADEPVGNSEGTPLEQVRHLLQGYNYVVTQARPGVLEKVRIISPRSAGGSSRNAAIQTHRVGAHHQVDAVLVGPSSMAKTLPLMIDTGASTIVLPASMISELGFTAEDLHDGRSQTASGEEPIKIGQLRSVRVGAVSASSVTVSFMPDNKLKGNKLLGMSFLQRFKVTIDDENNEFILTSK